MSKCKLSYFKRSNSFFWHPVLSGGGGILSVGMIEWEQKSTPPPPPPKKETLGTPKNFFCFIHNIRMTTSNCFEYAKNPHVNEILTENIPEPKISNPQKILQSPPSLEIRSLPPPSPPPPNAPNSILQPKVIRSSKICSIIRDMRTLCFISQGLSTLPAGN